MRRHDRHEGPGDSDCRYDREGSSGLLRSKAEDQATARDLACTAGRFIRAEQQTATCGGMHLGPTSGTEALRRQRVQQPKRGPVTYPHMFAERQLDPDRIAQAPGNLHS